MPKQTVMIRIEAPLLKRMDAAAAEEGMGRSEWLRFLARREVDRLDAKRERQS